MSVSISSILVLQAGKRTGFFSGLGLSRYPWHHIRCCQFYSIRTAVQCELMERPRGEEGDPEVDLQWGFIELGLPNSWLLWLLCLSPGRASRRNINYLVG